MKIYVGNIFLNELNSETLEKNELINNYIYSTDGIFLIKNNDIIKLIPNDIPVEKYSFDKYNFLIVKSEYIFRKNIYTIPYKHTIETINKTEYKHNIKSKVNMVIEKKNGIRCDLYFETREKELYEELKKDIIKYLSLFKEY